tara:strand:+ start:76 stop:384 length:309 start_codon:yes stop_codon:yes gene_type:complete
MNTNLDTETIMDINLDTTILQTKTAVELINCIEQLVKLMEKFNIQLPSELQRVLLFIRQETIVALRLDDDNYRINAQFLKNIDIYVQLYVEDNPFYDQKHLI